MGMKIAYSKCLVADMVEQFAVAFHPWGGSHCDVNTRAAAQAGPLSESVDFRRHNGTS
jgi:hypothetical protein